MASPGSREERRCCPRVPFTVRIWIQHDGREFSGYSTDISTAGIFVETTESVPLHGFVRLSFKVAGRNGSEALEVESRIARTVPLEVASAQGLLPGLGIEFRRFVLGRVELLAQIVERLGERQHEVPESAQERRTSPRLGFGLPIRWSIDPSPTRDGLIVNISATGAYVSTREPEPPGTRIYLSLDLPVYGATEIVKVIAQVVRTRLPEAVRGGGEPPGMGIAFDQSTIEIDELHHCIGERMNQLARQLQQRERLESIAARAASRESVPAQPQAEARAARVPPHRDEPRDLDLPPPRKQKKDSSSSVAAEGLGLGLWDIDPRRLSRAVVAIGSLATVVYLALRVLVVYL